MSEFIIFKPEKKQPKQPPKVCPHCNGERYVRLGNGHAPCAHCNPFF